MLPKKQPTQHSIKFSKQMFPVKMFLCLYVYHKNQLTIPGSDLILRGITSFVASRCHHFWINQRLKSFLFSSLDDLISYIAD